MKRYIVRSGKDVVGKKVIDKPLSLLKVLTFDVEHVGVVDAALGNRGQGAVDAITAAGLKELPGITGSADEAVKLFVKGELKPNFAAKCDHHGEHHHVLKI